MSCEFFTLGNRQITYSIPIDYDQNGSRTEKYH